MILHPPPPFMRHLHSPPSVAQERELEYRYECATCKRSGLQVSLCEACHSRYLNGHHNVHSPDHVFEPIAPVTRFLTYGAAPAPPPPSVNRRGPFG